MKKVLIDNEIKKDDITDYATRVKVLIINSKNEIVIGYSYNTYQFVGGHVEENESLVETINREIEEETGAILDLKSIEPFFIREEYYKDWPSVNRNKSCLNYYYILYRDIVVNLDNTNYTDDEKKGNFEIRYINMNNLIDEIKNNYNIFPDAKNIGLEMIDALNALNSN